MIPRWVLRVWFTFALIVFHSCVPTPKPSLPASDTLAALQFFAALHVEPVRISVYPPAAMVPNTFRVRIRIVSHPDNRALCWAYDGPQQQRFCWTVDGERAANTETVFWFLRVPGSYTASADLTRIEGGTERHYLARQDFQVLGGLN